MSRYSEIFKNKDTLRSVLRWVSRLTAKSRKALCGLFALNTAIAAAGVLVSWVNKSIVDQAQDKAAFHTLVAIMVALQLFSILGGMLASFAEQLIREKYACQVRQNLFGQILELPWLTRSRYHSEELLSRLTSDIDQITSGVSSLIVSVGALMIRLLLAFLLLWSFSPLLAVCLIVMTPLGVLANLFICRKMNRLQKDLQQNEADGRVFLQERLSKAELIRLFGQEESSMQTLRDIHEERIRLVRKRNVQKALSVGVIGLTFTGAQMIAFITGAVMVSEGAITFGVMTAFLSLVGQIQGPVFSLARQLPQIISVFASAQRVMEISGPEPGAETAAETFDTVSALGLRAKDLCLKYGNDDVVKNVSFDISPGQMAMLAGPSGIGKTTLLRSVIGFLPASSGHLDLYAEDGAAYPCSPAHVKHISYVPQGNTLIFGSVADNLRMGKSDATLEEMNRALEKADALAFVESLPDGIDTLIGEKATGISEGQAQRIAIARALLKDSALLILDEATSALDEKTEEKILNAVAQSRHQTCLFVSHRLYLKKYADTVIELTQ